MATANARTKTNIPPESYSSPTFPEKNKMDLAEFRANEIKLQGGGFKHAKKESDAFADSPQFESQGKIDKFYRKFEGKEKQ